MTNAEAIKKGYLEEKIISLKPSPRKSQMGITDPKHAAYFQIDQGSTFFCLPETERGDLVNIFKDSDEREFFENALELNLNPSKPGNYFETFQIQVVKDSKLMYKGMPFDMSNPKDNIRARVLNANMSVAPSWEDRFKKMEYRWALVDTSKIEKEAEIEYDTKAEFFMMLGKHQDTTDLRILLKIYFASINSDKVVTSDMKKPMLIKEINLISEDPEKRKRMLALTEDGLFSIKEMIMKALESKLIDKQGVDTYSFVGEEKTYTFDDITKLLSDSKNEDTEIYFKIKGQLENNKE